MKKTTDIILRIIIVAVILGAIGYYYYKRFTKPVAPILKSEVIKLPEKPDFSPKPEEVNLQKPDNKSVNKVKIETDNSTIQKQINYSILIENILSQKELNEIVNFLKQFKNVKFNTSNKTGRVLFKRVLIGPYSRKIDVIKMEGKISEMKIKDYLRLKLRGYYFLHVGSFADNNRLKSFVTFLKQNRIYNIKYMDVKVKKKIYSINITLNSNDTFKQIKSFLDQESVTYKFSKNE